MTDEIAYPELEPAPETQPPTEHDGGIEEPAGPDEVIE